MAILLMPNNYDNRAATEILPFQNRIFAAPIHGFDAVPVMNLVMRGIAKIVAKTINQTQVNERSR